jgi:small GTP-binding protein
MSKSKQKNNANKIEEIAENTIIKILIIGEVGVGKSNFIYRYIEDKFSPTILASVGFDSNTKVLNYENKKIIVQLWDSAGQSMYRTITKKLFNRVQGIIILYDITDLNSFLSVENWIQLIEEENKKIIYEIAGNKCDLNELRKVNINQGKELGSKYRINFFETSAKKNININESVNSLIMKILESDDLEYNPTFSIDKRSLKVRTKDSNERCC